MAEEYISISDLESYFVDKDTGAPLAGGYLQFWQDSDRTVPKLVFEKQQTGADPVTGSPVYQFVPLPDPIQLSAVGTPQDANGNNITIYYYPYDADGNVELYYVAAFNYLAVPQFTREGVPNTFATDEPGVGESSLENQISNPQFIEVNFDPNFGVTISSSVSGTKSVEIAPDWILQIVFGAAGNVVVNRESNPGNSNLPTNPPYILSITPRANVSQLSLIQKLPNTPGIWSPASAEIEGWVATNIVVGPNTTGLSVNYVPSSGASTTLLTASNTSSTYEEFSNSVELPPSANTSAPPIGFTNIVINLATSTPSLITSVQVVPTNGELTGLLFNQDTFNRQLDHLFNYYKSKLDFKPIPSYLVGWNFPQNPAQFLGTDIAAQAVGAAKSYYIWDQTIVFQSVDSALTVSRDSTGALKILAALTSQHALVQYLPAPVAIEMLSRRKCVHICANASVATVATVSLWYTKDALPSTVASNDSMVLTLDANGYPATQNGTWIQVPRGGLSNSTVLNNGYTNAAQFTIPIAPTGAASFNSIALQGWDMQGNTDINSATFFAIVVGTASLNADAYVLWQDIACQDGDIATVSAPKTMDSVLRECQYYYESSFLPGTIPTNNAGVLTGEFMFPQTTGTGASQVSNSIPYRVTKFATPTTLTLYNPAQGNAQCRNETHNNDCTGTTTINLQLNGFAVIFTTNSSASEAGNKLGIHWSADSRLAQ